MAEWFTKQDSRHDPGRRQRVAGARGADLHYARLGQKDSAALASLIAFHAQQAVEKALKSVLVRRDMEFPKTHDLEELVELVKGGGVVWPDAFNKVLEFTPFATHARYPGFDDPTTQADVDEAISLADQVVAWARQEVAAGERNSVE